MCVFMNMHNVVYILYIHKYMFITFSCTDKKLAEIAAAGGHKEQQIWFSRSRYLAWLVLNLLIIKTSAFLSVPGQRS